MDLTLRVCDEIRNSGLARALLAVVVRLEDALKYSVPRVMDEVDFKLARRISDIALRLGNASAWRWASDLSFVRFLAVMRINEPSVLRS